MKLKTRLIATAAALGASATLGITAASATPAAASGNHLCQSSGSYCAGSNYLSDGSAVFTKSTGRDMAWHGNGGQWCWNGTCYATGTLAFTAASDECAHVTSANYDDVYMNSCSGVIGVTWGISSSNGHLVFINKAATEHFGRNLEVLASYNSSDQQFFVSCWTCTGYQRYDWQ